MRKPKQQLLAITDIETSGLSPLRHEILEVGMLVVDSRTLEILDSFEEKVAAESIESASQRALEWNGYNPDEWSNAITLSQCIEAYAQKTKGAMFCGHNVAFDWSFMIAAYEKTGVKMELDYHRLDIFSLAWAHFRDQDFGTITLDALAEHFGLESEIRPHRAMNGAMLAYKVLGRLLDADLA